MKTDRYIELMSRLSELDEWFDQDGVEDSEDMSAKIAESHEIENELRADGYDPDIELEAYKSANSDASDEYLDTGSRVWDAWDDWKSGRDSGTVTSGKGGKSSWKASPKCAHTHPLTVIDGLEIQGASCYSPQGKYDIEIGFDSGMRLPDHTLPFKFGATEKYLFRIPDRGVPHDKELFDQLIDWTIEQMKAGKKIHCGCIGGHGRTGLFLAVLRFKITGDKKSPEWIRKNYCSKAIESPAQVNWLHDKYGLEKVEPRDGWHKPTKKDKKDAQKLQFKGKVNERPKQPKFELPKSTRASDRLRITRSLDSVEPKAGRTPWGDSFIP